MAGGSKGISGIGLTTLFGGSLLLWSAIKGRKWTGVLRELIAGEEPKATNEYPISSSDSDGGGLQTGTGTLSGADKARASSFWGTHTASGRAMDATTIASPYLPLGTQVTIEYKGKTVNGTVWDFGPADWVMAADPTRFLDIAEPMMQALTGQKGNVISVNYKVTHYATNGRIYRPGSSMTAKLRNRWAGK